MKASASRSPAPCFSVTSCFWCLVFVSWLLFHWLPSACLWAYLWPWAGLCHGYLLAMDKVRICESLKHLKLLCRRCIEALKQSETRHHILMTLFCETMTQTRPNKAARDARLSMTVISTCFGAFSTLQPEAPSVNIHDKWVFEAKATEKRRLCLL